MRDQDASYHGKWFLPGQQNQALRGTLDCSSPLQPNLVLHGSLTKTHSVSSIPIILGVDVGGTAITLRSCSLRSIRTGLSRLAITELEPSLVYFGAHIADQASERFNGASFCLENLAQWFGHTPSTEYVRESPRNVTFGANTISLSKDTEVRHHGRAAIHVLLGSTRSYEEWISEYLHPLRNLITLALGKATYRTELSFCEGQGETAQWIEVLEKNALKEVRPSRTRLPHEMLFSYRDLDQRWDAALTRWLQLHTKANDALNIFFSLDYAPDMFIEQHFRGMVGALEGLHRRLYPKRNRRDKKHQALLDEIETGCPEKHREWLMAKLQYSHEPALKERLTDLMKEAETSIQPFLRRPYDEMGALMISRVVATRNFLVHTTGKRAKVLSNIGDMWKHTFVLRLIMLVNLLKELTEDRSWAEERVARWLHCQGIRFELE